MAQPRTGQILVMCKVDFLEHFHEMSVATVYPLSEHPATIYGIRPMRQSLGETEAQKKRFLKEFDYCSFHQTTKCSSYAMLILYRFDLKLLEMLKQNRNEIL